MSFGNRWTHFLPNDSDLGAFLLLPDVIDGDAR